MPKLTEHESIPPLRNLRVLRHQPSMDVRLLRERATSLSPNLLPEVEECMHSGGGDGSKGESVGDGEGCREEEGRVPLVRVQV